jgi:cell division protein FtsL
VVLEDNLLAGFEEAKMTQICIVKQIDNSRLTKEVDYERTKECLLLMVLGVFCLLLLLLLAWQHFQIVRHGYETEVLKEELASQAELSHQLKLERAYLRSPQRIDLIARAKLGLQPPSFDQIMVLSEPFPTELSTTLVARSERVPFETTLVKTEVIH